MRFVVFDRIIFDRIIGCGERLKGLKNAFFEAKNVQVKMGVRVIFR